MDYKSVLEEQIRELQKVQDQNVRAGDGKSACEVAETIMHLLDSMWFRSLKENEPECESGSEEIRITSPSVSGIVADHIKVL